MADVAAALSALGIQEWVLRGEPTTEDEFKTMFSKVTGSDSNGSAIESQDPADWGTTWAAISAKQKELADAAPMVELRLQRNAKLAETDWQVTKLLELGESIPSDLANERAALRTECNTKEDEINALTTKAAVVDYALPNLI